MTKTIDKDIQKMDKVPHPKGRKVAQLMKKTNKIAARQKIRHAQQMKTNIIGEKFLWFKDNLNKNIEVYTPELLIELIEKYHNRFNDELEQIKLKHSVGKRKGRQHASREDIIKMTLAQERSEFNTYGIELPDMLNVKQFSLLKNWSGELRLLQNFKLARFSKSKLLNMIKEKGAKGKEEGKVEKMKEDARNEAEEEKKQKEDKSNEDENVSSKSETDGAEEEMDTE